MDIFPGEFFGIEKYEEEFRKKLNIGDYVRIVMDSQFLDCFNGEKLKRRIGEAGIITDRDPGDEWAYKIKFDDGRENWFKRCHLERLVSF